MTGDGTGAERRALLDALARAPARIARAALSAEGRPPAAGEWDAGAVVRHLIAVDRDVFSRRLAQLASADRSEPHWRWVEPGPDAATEGLPLVELTRIFAALRTATVASAGRLDDAGWARSGMHETLGRLDVAALLRVACDHDEDHLAALEVLGAAASAPRPEARTGER